MGVSELIQWALVMAAHRRSGGRLHMYLHVYEKP